MSKPTAADLLAKFPAPVTLNRSITKWIWVLIISAGFTAGFIAMLAHPDASRGNPLMEWFGLTFFGAGSIIAAIMLMPGSGSLMLDRQGFSVRSLFRSHEVAWTDASGFTVYDATFGQSFKTTQSVAYNLAASNESGVTGMLSHVTRQLIDGNAALPETYGMNASELVMLMEGWRARALTTPATATRPAAEPVSFGRQAAPTFGRRQQPPAFGRR